MKKVLFLLAMLPMMIFTACSSDDEKEDVFTLTGTYVYRWKAMLGDENLSYNIRFIDKSKYEFTYKADDFIWDERISNYVIDYPSIYFKDFGTDNFIKDVTGTIIDERTIRIESKEFKKE